MLLEEARNMTQTCNKAMDPITENTDLHSKKVINVWSCTNKKWKFVKLDFIPRGAYLTRKLIFLTEQLNHENKEG